MLRIQTISTTKNFSEATLKAWCGWNLSQLLFNILKSAYFPQRFGGVHPKTKEWTNLENGLRTIYVSFREGIHHLVIWEQIPPFTMPTIDIFLFSISLPPDIFVEHS